MFSEKYTIKRDDLEKSVEIQSCLLYVSEQGCAGGRLIQYLVEV